MAYKKILASSSSSSSFKKEKRLYIYLYNDYGLLDDINDRPAFVCYKNGIVNEEMHYCNGKIKLNINKPHHIMYDLNGNITYLSKKATNVGCYLLNHQAVSAVYFNETGNITTQEWTYKEKSFVADYFEIE